MVGQQILNYQIVKEISRGGMGVVYKARDKNLPDRFVALKTISPDLASDLRFKVRFRDEAQKLAKLYQHANIVTIYDYVEDEEGQFIVMEYVEGRTLEQLIDGHRQDFPLELALHIAKECLSVMSYAHNLDEPVIHRDIKPSNIMITRLGEKDVVKVTDWGVAKVLRETPTGKSTVLCGTEGYAAPEQGMGKADRRSDIYSLGITLYEMLTGGVPYMAFGAFDRAQNGDRHCPNDTQSREVYSRKEQDTDVEPPSPDFIRSNIPKKVGKVVMKAIRKDPAKRYQSAQEMLTALEKCEQDSSGLLLKRSFYVSAIFIVVFGLAYLFWANAPQLASVTFASDPPSATIFVDDIEIGQTPLANHQVDAGIRLIRLEKEGYDVWEKQDSLIAGREHTIRPKLQSLFGEIDVFSSPPGAVLLIDGEKIGATPHENVRRDPGLYSVRIEKPDYEVWQKDIRIKAGQNTVIKANLRRLAIVILHSVPPVKVFIDSQPTASNQEVVIPQGPHQIRFEHPEHGVAEFPIAAMAGQPEKYTCYYKHAIHVTSFSEWGFDEQTAVIVIDGEKTDSYTGQEPIVKGPGKYEITVYRNGFETVEEAKTVEVKPSLERKTHALTFKLRKL